MSGRADGKSGVAPVSEVGRSMLADFMKEGLGDHVLLLRLYQVRQRPPNCLLLGCTLSCWQEILRVMAWDADHSVSGSVYFFPPFLSPSRDRGRK